MTRIAICFLIALMPVLVGETMPAPLPMSPPLELDHLETARRFDPVYVDPQDASWPVHDATLQFLIVKTAGMEMTDCSDLGPRENCDTQWAHIHEGDGAAESVTLSVRAYNNATRDEVFYNYPYEIQFYVHGVAVSGWIGPPYSFDLEYDNAALNPILDGIHDISIDARLASGINTGTMNTTVLSAASATVLTLQSGQGANVSIGDFVRLGYGDGSITASEVREVTGKSTDTLTLASDLFGGGGGTPRTPIAGDRVYLMKRTDIRYRAIFLHINQSDQATQTTLVPLIEVDCEYCFNNNYPTAQHSLEYVDSADRNIRGWPIYDDPVPWTEIPHAEGLPSAADLYQEVMAPHSDLFLCMQMWWEEPSSSPDAGLPFARCIPPKFDETWFDPGLRVTWFHNRLPVRDGQRGVAWVSPYNTGRVQANGDYYFVETTGRFAKMTPTGTVTTFAGWRVKVDEDPIWVTKPLTTIRENMDLVGTWPGGDLADGFHTPLDVDCDPQNLLHCYVVGEGDNGVWKVDLSTSPATISLFVGSTSRTAGYVNATGNSARFSGPTSLAWDAAGDFFYVTDFKNDAVRKVSRAGVVTTLFGQDEGEGTKSAEIVASKCAATVYGIPPPWTANQACSQFEGANADALSPMTVRTDSNDDLIVYDVGYASIRRYKFADGEVEEVGVAGPNRYDSSSGIGWGWIDVDKWGNSGPIDGIYGGCFQCSNVFLETGNRVNELYFWMDPTDGTAYYPAGPDQDNTPEGFGSYYYTDFPHYMWAVAVDPRGGVYLAGGGEHGITRLRKRRESDINPTDKAVGGTGVAGTDYVHYYSGDVLWTKGDVSVNQPSPEMKHGHGGFGMLGFASTKDLTLSTTDEEIRVMFEIPDSIWDDATKKSYTLHHLRSNMDGVQGESEGIRRRPRGLRRPD